VNRERLTVSARAAPGRARLAATTVALPDFALKVNGAELSAKALEDVRSITVEEDLDALSMFTVELYNWDAERLQVSWSDSSQFAVGGEVEVWLGWVDDLERVMLGEITGLEPSFTSEQPPMLTVRGYDHRHRMGRSRRTRTFLQMKDSAIAAQMAREAGLRAQAQDTRTTLAFVVQSNQTDWELLRQRAGLIGWEVYVRDKVLYYRPPGHTARPSARLSLGEDVTEFTPRLSSLGQQSQMTVRTWDVKRKEVIVGSAAAGQEEAMGRVSGPSASRRAWGAAPAAIVDRSVRTRAEADQIALGQFKQSALGYVQGTVVCTGRADLHAGRVVEIEGAGRAFSGPYYVTSVSHTLSQAEGYRTSLTVERNAT
jgi:phage protein D